MTPGLSKKRRTGRGLVGQVVKRVEDLLQRGWEDCNHVLLSFTVCVFSSFLDRLDSVRRPDYTPTDQVGDLWPLSLHCTAPDLFV